MRDIEEMKGGDGYYHPRTIEESLACIDVCPNGSIVMESSVMRDIGERILLLENIVAEALPGIERLTG